jgi:predicted nucleic acid-binding protein
MRLLLDTNVLHRLCLPRHPDNRSVVEWLTTVLIRLADRVTVFLPEIADYELRRGLLHLALKEGQETNPRLARLDELGQHLDYLSISTPALRRAASIWAQARHSGRPAASPDALDGDAILAAQALEVGGTVVTENTDHFDGVVPAQRWEEVAAKLGATPSP